MLALDHQVAAGTKRSEAGSAGSSRGDKHARITAVIDCESSLTTLVKTDFVSLDLIRIKLSSAR